MWLVILAVALAGGAALGTFLATVAWYLVLSEELERWRPYRPPGVARPLVVALGRPPRWRSLRRPTLRRDDPAHRRYVEVMPAPVVPSRTVVSGTGGVQSGDHRGRGIRYRSDPDTVDTLQVDHTAGMLRSPPEWGEARARVWGGRVPNAGRR